ncbi:MAG TPA: HmuY family protein, partial [Gemmatimonadales bacterium]|nr:HmuY family protein [Gemmatimonadales bacterium]
MMLRYRTPRALRALPLVLLLPALACESDSSGPKGPDAPGVVELDASSNTAFTFFRLSDGAVVAVTDPTSSTEWDLAVRRFAVKLNGGVAGPKGVVAFNMRNNQDATDQQVLGFTPENQLAAFEAVSPADIPDDADFEEEGLGPDVSTWFRFDPVSGGLVANPAAAWKLRRSGGSTYGVIRVKRLVASATALDSVTFEYRLQGGAALGAASEITIPTTGSNAVNLGNGTA